MNRGWALKITILNGQGIALHANRTRWVEEQITGWIGSLTLQKQAMESERIVGQGGAQETRNIY